MHLKQSLSKSNWPFCRNLQADPKINMELQRTLYNKYNVENRKTELEDLAHPIFKTYHKTYTNQKSLLLIYE